MKTAAIGCLYRLLQEECHIAAYSWLSFDKTAPLFVNLKHSTGGCKICRKGELLFRAAPVQELHMPAKLSLHMT